MSEIKIQFKNGESRNISAPVSVGEALKSVDREAAKRALAAKVNGAEVDLNYQLNSNGDEIISVEPILPETRNGLDVLRHSTAHLLAAAVLDLFPGTKLGVGPALLDDPRYGFYYDMIAPQHLTEADLPVIEKRMRQIAGKNLAYRREIFEKDEILGIFTERDEPLKCELISEKIAAGEKASIYYIDGSPFIDFCLGPHVPNTNKLKAFKLLALSGAYWKGDAANQ
ncbi:MAG: TGS domain-containing protein, partial [Pyrinomonadaceae bacterium]